jgi:hypothetical protein
VPAQRRKRRIENKSKGRKYGLFFRLFIPAALILSLIFLFKVNTKYWNGEDKVAFAYLDGDNVAVAVLDGEETVLVIPGETSVSVARGYGTLRIKNVWQLGINEKLDGSLLAQTVTQNFHFPTTLWSEKGNKNIREFVFSPGKTNISFSDRLNIALFSIKVKSIDKTVINLGESQFLKKQKLIDGQLGYMINGPISQRLTVYFSDNNFADKNIKFGFADMTGKNGIAESVGGILEVLGGKVVSIDRQAKDDSVDCEVKGQNEDAVKKVSVLFACKKVSGESAFDVEMKIGARFAKRY